MGLAEEPKEKGGTKRNTRGKDAKFFQKPCSKVGSIHHNWNPYMI